MSVEVLVPPSVGLERRDIFHVNAGDHQEVARVPHRLGETVSVHSLPQEAHRETGL